MGGRAWGRETVELPFENGARPRGAAGTLAAVGVGGEERGVGLDHEAVDGDELRGVAELPGVLVGDDAGERQHRTKVEDLAGVGRRAGEAVEDHLRGVEARRLQDRNQVVEGLTAVEDDRKREVAEWRSGRVAE
jgi:hypothetical protein